MHSGHCFVSNEMTKNGNGTSKKHPDIVSPFSLFFFNGGMEKKIMRGGVGPLLGNTNKKAYHPSPIVKSSQGSSSFSSQLTTVSFISVSSLFVFHCLHEKKQDQRS